MANKFPSLGNNSMLNFAYVNSTSTILYNGFEASPGSVKITNGITKVLLIGRIFLSTVLTTYTGIGKFYINNNEDYNIIPSSSNYIKDGYRIIIREVKEGDIITIKAATNNNNIKMSDFELIVIGLG